MKRSFALLLIVTLLIAVIGTGCERTEEAKVTGKSPAKTEQSVSAPRNEPARSETVREPVRDIRTHEYPSFADLVENDLGGCTSGVLFGCYSLGVTGVDPRDDHFSIRDAVREKRECG